MWYVYNKWIIPGQNKGHQEESHHQDMLLININIYVIDDLQMSFKRCVTDIDLFINIYVGDVYKMIYIWNITGSKT